MEHSLCTQWFLAPGSCPRLLQHENEELRRRLTYVTNKMEAMERELESGQDYLEMELGQNREELEKFKDKFRRYDKENEGIELERSLSLKIPSAGVSGLCPVVQILEKVRLQTLGEIKALQPLFLPRYSVGMLPA